MIFESLSIQGCFLITRNIPIDQRGYFSRIVDVESFRKYGLNADFLQVSVSQNYHKGTLRGLHSQIGEFAEEKLVTCVQGEVFDVCVDMREGSSTYMEYCSAILSEENGGSLYIPKGCAHGFLSLKDNSQLIYFMTSKHNPASEQGYRWDDTAFSIKWPISPEIISEKDKGWSLIK